MSNFSLVKALITPDSSKSIFKIDIKLVVKDTTGEVGVTDLMLQSGSISTLWKAHPSELRWTVDN